LRRRQALRRGGQRGEVPRRRGLLRRLPAGGDDARRLRLRQGVPRRALPARSAAGAHRADHAAAHPLLHRRARARTAEVLLMATFLVAHGAWSAAWAWKKVRPLLRARGHEIFTPTHAGLGERVREAEPHIDLETHIADLLAVIAMEDLRDFILLGHSYGGMVA